MKLKSRRPSLLNPVLRIALGYFIASALWIGASDRILAMMIQDPVAITRAQTWKGWFFVTVTSIIIGWLVRRELLKYGQAREAMLSAQDLAAENERRYRLVFDQSPLPMWIYAQDTRRILTVNDAAVAHYGYTRQEWMRLNINQLRPKEEIARLEKAMKHVHGQMQYGGETWTHLKKDGTRIEVDIASDELPFNGLQARLVIARDVTAQHEAEERMYRLAYFDPLTGLMNRAGLIDYLASALLTAHVSPVGLILLDLDRFRDINDSMGHVTGDQVLIEVAQRLRDALPQSTSIARISADLYAVVQDVVGEAEAITLGQRLTDLLDYPITLDGGRSLRLTACVGIALAPGHGNDKDTLLRNAEAALHNATARGRDTFSLYRETMNVDTLERLALESDLRHALARNEFILHYQPQIARNGRVVGVEALVRWNHPTRGLVPPNAFIPVAENCGVIVALGTWVLESACRQGRLWMDAGLGAITIAVNLSAIQFREANLVDNIANILATTGYPADRLELEVTESVIMTDVDEVMATLVKLREMGIQLAIDDFGTGYSSLAYLRQLSLTKLKIDQSFVFTLPSDENAAAIASTIVALGKNLHLAVIAEGVETEAQASFLQSIGCDQMQGYLFSRPLPAEQIDAFIRNALYR